MRLPLPEKKNVDEASHLYHTPILVELIHAPILAFLGKKKANKQKYYKAFILVLGHISWAHPNPNGANVGSPLREKFCRLYRIIDYRTYIVVFFM